MSTRLARSILSLRRLLTRYRARMWFDDRAAVRFTSPAKVRRPRQSWRRWTTSSPSRIASGFK
jgi:hypothetical protein